MTVRQAVSAAESFSPPVVEQQRRRAAQFSPHEHVHAEPAVSVSTRRADAVARAGLVNRLRVGRAASVVAITAPAGYGKTTLVSEWARRDRRPFAWCGIDERDDAATFASHLAAAIHRVRPAVPEPPIGPTPNETIARLGRMLSESSADIVIVLDDVSRLRDEDSTRLLDRLVAELPPESQIALLGRRDGPLHLGRLRAQGALLEIGVDDLRFTDREAAALLHKSGTDLLPTEVRSLNAAVEGWPKGLRLAADADDPHGPMLEYFHAEVLSQLPDDHVKFLTRVSTLDRLCAPLCDAVAGVTGSAKLLDLFHRSGLFLLPLDRHSGWYRLHAAFRSVLAVELERREPGLRRTLWSRAAGWLAERADPVDALDYARSAGDVDMLRGLVERSALPFAASGQPEDIDRWLSPLDDAPELERHPKTAATGALAWALSGRPADADRWAAAVERSADAGEATAEPWQALLRALMCPTGVEAMQNDAERAIAMLQRDRHWLAPALLALACAHALGGDSERADSTLRVAADSAAAAGPTALLSVILGYQSLLATGRGDWAEADALALAADPHREGFEDDVTSLFWLAADARFALRHGDWLRVQRVLESADVLLPRLSDAIGTFSVLLRLEFAQVHLALGETRDALRMLAEIDAIFVRRPRLGILHEQVLDLRTEIASFANGPMSRLTAVELRLLPLLATHLSFREIADRLYVSRNTVKTQAISVYRKLGVSSRGDAIRRAAHLGLVAEEHPAEVR